MPEFTHDDRCVLSQEYALWAVVAVLNDANKGTDAKWSQSINKLRDDALALARVIRAYNDKFEAAE